jgi:hypothetical protein
MLLEGGWLAENLRPAGEESNFEGRPKEEEYLRRWSDADKERFGEVRTTLVFEDIPDGYAGSALHAVRR